MGKAITGEVLTTESERGKGSSVSPAASKGCQRYLKETSKASDEET